MKFKLQFPVLQIVGESAFYLYLISNIPKSHYVTPWMSTVPSCKQCGLYSVVSLSTVLYGLVIAVPVRVVLAPSELTRRLSDGATVHC